MIEERTCVKCLLVCIVYLCIFIFFIVKNDYVHSLHTVYHPRITYIHTHTMNKYIEKIKKYQCWKKKKKNSFGVDSDYDSDSDIDETEVVRTFRRDTPYYLQTPSSIQSVRNTTLILLSNQLVPMWQERMCQFPKWPHKPHYCPR